MSFINFLKKIAFFDEYHCLDFKEIYCLFGFVELLLAVQ